MPDASPSASYDGDRAAAERDGRLLPLSHAQEGIWFVHQLNPEETSYNLHRALRLRGRLRVGVLVRAVGELVRRHEVLRTVFVFVAGEPRQLVLAGWRARLERVDLGGLAAGERERALARLGEQQAGLVFELEREPPLRLTLARLGADEHALFLTTHHLIVDGWSLALLFDELAALYQAYEQGRPSPLPEPSLQYGDYTLWQHEQLTQERLQQQLRHWQHELADTPTVLELPSSRPRPQQQRFRGGALTFTLPPSLTSRLRALARQHQTTLFTTLLAGYQTLLHRNTGPPRILTGTVTSGRTHSQLEPLIGCLVNTLPLKTDLSDNPSFSHHLNRTRTTTLTALHHQDTPYDKLVEHLQPPRHPNRTPLVQVLFSFQAIPDEVPRFAGLEVESITRYAGQAKFDLSLDCTDDGTAIQCLLEYDADVVDDRTADVIAADFARVLTAVVERDLRVGDIPLTSEAAEDGKRDSRAAAAAERDAATLPAERV